MPFGLVLGLKKPPKRAIRVRMRNGRIIRGLRRQSEGSSAVFKELRDAIDLR